MLNLLSLALSFETRSLVRNRVGAISVIAYVLIGALAVGLGERHVQGWNDAIQTAQEAQQKSINDARGYLASGKGPADKSWVNLRQARWQDEYAGTRVVREPSALAGIAAGSVDPAPVAFTVTRRADPMSAGGYKIENPELAAGSVDLVFVLTILSPLLLGVLGLGIGGREREEKIDRIIVVQAGSLGGWLLARFIAVTLIGAVCSSSLCLVVCALTGASLIEATTLVGLVIGYTLFWGGVLSIVGAFARSVREAALTFGAVWMTLCIVLPTVAAEVSLTRVQNDFGVAETLEARALRYEAYESAIQDVAAQVYAEYPHLANLPAARDSQLDGQTRRHAYEAILAAEVAERYTGHRISAASAQHVAVIASYTSPAVALTLCLERLTGVGPEAAMGFQGYALDAVNARVQWVLEKAWAKQPLTASDFEALVSDTPPPFRWTPESYGRPSLALCLWGFGVWGLALMGLRRKETLQDG